jgi:hypothetical protein
MKTKPVDRIKAVGTFHAKVYEHGKIVKEYTDKNMVVQLGLNFLAQLVAGDVVQPIGVIGFGDDGTAPNIADNALGTSNFFKTADSVAYLAPGKVVIEWSLDSGEANGILIKEYALCLIDNTIFARKVGLTINKVPGTTAEGTWTIEFVQ